MIVYLTSCLDLYEKDEEGNRIPHHFGNENKILDNLKRHIKKYDNFLFVASDEHNHEATDMYAEKTFESFALTLPFKNYVILDGRTKDRAEELVASADFIFLCGGHVPTQNDFFKNINLREIIQNTSAVVLGGSAGSMNSADIVYCPPELEGESLDPNFKRYFKGLGLSDINIYPHWNKLKDEMLDGKRMTEDIVLPDSYDIDILVLDDGSYVLHEDDKTTVYGSAYLMKDGQITQICEKEQTIDYKNQKPAEIVQ